MPFFLNINQNQGDGLFKIFGRIILRNIINMGNTIKEFLRQRRTSDAGVQTVKDKYVKVVWTNCSDFANTINRLTDSTKESLSLGQRY